MIEIAELNVRALAEMAKRINDDIQMQFENFGKGGWIIRDDVGATGMAAVLIQAKITGLHAALKHIEETDKALTGRAPKKEMRAHG